jgi:lipopolysaccharide export system protein LptA
LHPHPLPSRTGRIGAAPLGGALFGAALFAAALLTPMEAAAQLGNQCQFVEGTENVTSNVVPGAGRVSHVSRPRIVCTDGVRIQADSAVAYSGQSMTHLIGHVRYRDGTRELRADDARYFSQVARLQANGHLYVRDFEQGSTIQNGELIYLRRTSFRAQEEMRVARGDDSARPRALLHVRPGVDTVTVDSAQAARGPSEPDTIPYEVEADRLFLRGEGYFSAGGDVVIERDSLVAHSDSAEYDQLAALMTLQGSARVDGPSYNLSGRRIEMAVPDGRMRSVHAVRDGVLLGDDLEMRAPSIEIFLADGSMDRLVAIRLVPPDSARATPAGGVPPPPVDSLDLVRPVARAEDFVLTADSVEVRTPGQVLDRIFAAGTARGESSARDSLNVPDLPEVARKDWLEGDTVTATFVRADPEARRPIAAGPEAGPNAMPDSLAGGAADSIPDIAPDSVLDSPSGTARTAAPDSARGGDFRLERLVAQGAARSLYRLLPADSTTRPGVDCPAISYVTGSMIVIVMDEGEVQRMEVEGPTEGWHMEPRSRCAPPDSLTPPDTSAVLADTADVAPDTARAAADTVRYDGPGRDAADGRGGHEREGRDGRGGPGGPGGPGGSGGAGGPGGAGGALPARIVSAGRPHGRRARRRGR